MSRAWILVLPLVATAAPAAAQLTPEQRQAVEVKAANATYSQRLVESWERRSLGGDPAAYGGMVARQERYRVWERDSWVRWLNRPNAEPADRDHWVALGDRPTDLGRLRRVGPVALATHPGRSTVLTLASPIGGPAVPLMIRTVAESETAGSGWSRMAEVVGDYSGRYYVIVPSLTPGTYELKIEVYDPAHPEAPVSGSRSQLVVQ